MRTAALLAIGLLLALSGCSSEPKVDFGPRTIAASKPSAARAAAGSEALRGVESIHDYENSHWDDATADGELSDEENEALMEMEAQADADYEKVIAPTFTECATAGEWLGLMRGTPMIVESTTSEAVTDWTLQSFCPRFADTPVCVDAADQGLEFEPAG